MLFIDTLPSSPLLPGLTKANCHRAIWATQRPQWDWGGWMELHQHPTLDHRRRQMRAPRPEVLPSSLYALRPVLSGTSQAQRLLQVPGCSPMAKTRFHIWDPGLGSQDPDHHCDTPALQGYPGRPRDSLSLSPTPSFPEAFAQV